jgi:antitoxin (DNA-binding transcriptional repressor) of toxin-antitoxin stability system
MGVKVSFDELHERLAELLDQVINNGAECVVQRDGKDCAVLVSARQWRLRTVGQRLDALGPSYRLSTAKQARAEALLARARRALTAKERRELNSLLRECDAILLRRAAAMDQLV